MSRTAESGSFYLTQSDMIQVAAQRDLGTKLVTADAKIVKRHVEIISRAVQFTHIPEFLKGAEERAAVLCNNLIDLNEAHLSAAPAEGRDFFRFPPLSSEAADQYKALSPADIFDIAHFWTNGNLKEVVTKDRDPRSIGFLLKGLAETHKDDLKTAISHVDLDREDPKLKAKLINRQVLVGSYNSPLRTPGVWEVLAQGKPEANTFGINKTKHEIHSLAQEIDKKAAIELFGYGIHTIHISEIVNHRRLDIFLNDFTEKQVPALREARKCPDYIDKWLGVDNVGMLLRTGIVAAQVKASGTVDDGMLAELAQKDEGEVLDKLALHYLYSGTPFSDIPNKKMKEMLAEPITQDVQFSVFYHIISANAPVDYQSSIIQQVIAQPLDAGDALELLTYAYNRHNANWNRINPFVRAALVVSLENGQIFDGEFAWLTASMVGFGTDYPDSIVKHIREPKNQGVISAFAGELKQVRVHGRYERTKDYPIHPLYALMSNGKQALPSSLQELIENPDTKVDFNKVATDLLSGLFIDGYYKHYFGSRSTEMRFPDPVVALRETYKKRWTIVHPDIWEWISQANPEVIRKFFEDKLPSDKIRMEFGLQSSAGSEGHADTPIEDCLPPEIIDKIGGLSFLYEQPSRGKSLKRRLKWTAKNPADRERQAAEKRVSSTDLVRNVLLPRYQRHGVDILTQVRLIHRAHMGGNEHILLHPGQAKRLLGNELNKVDRLAGVMRTKDRLKINIGLAGMMALCASHENTPKLMEKLAETMETLFPKDGVNPLVNEDTIHYYASAFQLAIAMIHPFYEANGRTSEDSMYILWQRRPDLQHTLRYVSGDGTRSSDVVDKRMDMINDYAVKTVRMVAVGIGAVSGTLLTPEQSRGIKKYQDMVKLFEGKGKYKTYPQQLERDYLGFYDEVMGSIIESIADANYVSRDGAVAELAKQLRNGSESYTSNAEPQLDDETESSITTGE